MPSTRGVTRSSVTSLAGRAFLFRVAGQERLFAADQGIPYQRWRARAHLPMTHDRALGVRSAHVGKRARIYERINPKSHLVQRFIQVRFEFFLTSTLVVQASETLLALDVSAAPDHAHQALADLPASTILVPSAQRFANSGGVAPLVAQTIQIRGADGGANVPYASCACGAVPVRLADGPGRPEAGNFRGWVRYEAGWARASGPLIEHRALGVRPARGRLAGIGALVRDARLVRVAVLVRPATERAHVVQAYVAQETVVVQSAGEQTVSTNAFLVERALVVAGADRQAHVVAACVPVVAVVGVSAGHWH